MAAFSSPQYTTAATESLLSGSTVTPSGDSSIFRPTDTTPPVHSELEQGQQPKITVTSDTSRPADFHVKADGTVDVAGKPLDGSKPLSEILEPAAKAAEDGYVVTPRVAQDWERNVHKLQDPITAKVMLKDGKAPRAGDTMKNPALARTLRRIGR